VLLGLQGQPPLAWPEPHRALLAEPDHAGDRPAHHPGVAQIPADRIGQIREHLLSDRPGPARARSAWTSPRTSRANARCPASSAPMAAKPASPQVRAAA